MLTPDTLAALASEPPERIARVLTLLSASPEGDAVNGYLAIHHPDEYRAVLVAIARGGAS